MGAQGETLGSLFSKKSRDPVTGTTAQQTISRVKRRSSDTETLVVRSDVGRQRQRISIDTNDVSG